MKLKYFTQEHAYTCNLANLRSVLSYYGINVKESELIDVVKSDYGKHFKNIWNPTIAKLARVYNISTKLIADWPLLKPENLKHAKSDYDVDHKNFNPNKYENINDKDEDTEPLKLAYSEMFKAIELGCEVEFGKLDQTVIEENIKNNKLIQTSIKLNRLYPGSKQAFHSILLHSLSNNQVIYNDPYKGHNLKTEIGKVINAATDVGAYIVFG